MTPPVLTPVQWVEPEGVWLKRDDTFELAGVRGGKVRSCDAIVRRVPDGVGVVTAGSRHSPQVQIVAALAAHYGVPCTVHVPAGPDTAETLDAALLGAGVMRHRPGHNSVIVARARADAAAKGWVEVPFGMECVEAVTATASQVANVLGSGRIVVPVGSGMTLAGVLHGLYATATSMKVLGVCVGADPTQRLNRWAPALWSMDTNVQLVASSHPYAHRVEGKVLGGVALDPIYEAKCLPWLQPGDVLWCVGHRGLHVAL